MSAAADGTPNPTYRCLFPEPPPPGTVPACAEAGVLGALAGVIGSMMALGSIREIVGFGESLVGRLVMIDARAMRFETLRYGWDPANPLSGEQPTIKDLSVHALIWPQSLRPHFLRSYLLHVAMMVEPLSTDHLFSSGAHHGEAIGPGALPGGAETVLGKFPGPLALGAAAVDRLALHLAVGRKSHLEFDVGRRRRGERLAVEKGRLNVVRRKFCGRRRHMPM